MTSGQHRDPLPETPYIPSLDGIRAVSIAIVFAAHAGVSRLIPGGFGVTIFFFLSGYLITSLLVREYEQYGSIALRAFYLRRVIRLGPPLLATLVMVFALFGLGWVDGALDVPTIASQVFFYYNYYSLYGDGISVDGLTILWSLSVEEHFYVIWPALFLAITRGRAGRGHVVALLVAILLWRCFRTLVMGDSEWVVYVSTDTRFDSLLYGCLLALMARDGSDRRIFRPDGAWPAALCLISLVMIGATFAIRGDLFRSSLRYSLQGIALMPLFYYAVTIPQRPPFCWLNGAVIRKLGVYSYTIYLAHYVILNALAYLGFDSEKSWLGLTLALVFSVGWAALVNEFLEKPLKGVRRRLTGHAAHSSRRTIQPKIGPGNSQ